MDNLEDRAFMRKILGKVYSYFQKYFHSDREAALAIALSSESDVYQLGVLLDNYSRGVVDAKIINRKEFSVAELLLRIPELAEFNFCDPSVFMDKKNFGKVSKAECFAR